MGLGVGRAAGRGEDRAEVVAHVHVHGVERQRLLQVTDRRRARSEPRLRRGETDERGDALRVGRERPLEGGLRAGRVAGRKCFASVEQVGDAAATPGEHRLEHRVARRDAGLAGHGQVLARRGLVAGTAVGHGERVVEPGCRRLALEGFRQEGDRLGVPAAGERELAECGQERGILRRVPSGRLERGRGIVLAAQRPIDVGQAEQGRVVEVVPRESELEARRGLVEPPLLLEQHAAEIGPAEVGRGQGRGVAVAGLGRDGEAVGVVDLAGLAPRRRRGGPLPAGLVEPRRHLSELRGDRRLEAGEWRGGHLGEYRGSWLGGKGPGEREQQGPKGQQGPEGESGARWPHRAGSGIGSPVPWRRVV